MAHVRNTAHVGRRDVAHLWLGLRLRKADAQTASMTSGPHTYRVQITPDPETGERSIRSALFPLLVLVGLVVLAGSTISGPRQLLDIMAALGVIGAFYGVLGWWSTRRDRDCREIRLSDDGTCELETKRRTIRLHVNQIRSVLYGRSEDGESYSIRYEGGKLYVDERMTGFHDFLDRLKTLNPAVDLSTFPADAWPGLATSADARATALRRGLRGALFPTSVVILLIWLAVETFR